MVHKERRGGTSWMAKKPVYNNESITSLKGADRVRRRPAVIFGSDGLEGCEHSIFEIVSNSIDEAREGYGKKIVVTRYNDDSVEVEDFGRGIPVDYNNAENRYNWELVFCEMYAGGKYKNEKTAVTNIPGPKWPGAVRHPVCVAVYGCGSLFCRGPLHPAF